MLYSSSFFYNCIKWLFFVQKQKNRKFALFKSAFLGAESITLTVTTHTTNYKDCTLEFFPICQV